jgi:hypothetical protein
MHISPIGKLKISYYSILVVLFTLESYLLLINVLSDVIFYGILLWYATVFGLVLQLAQATANSLIKYRIRLVVVLASVITILALLLFTKEDVLQLIAFGVIAISILGIIDIINWNGKRQQKVDASTHVL